MLEQLFHLEEELGHRLHCGEQIHLGLEGLLLRRFRQI
jgi:hypothetical protein